MNYATIRLRKPTEASPYPTAVHFHMTRSLSGGFHVRNVEGLGMPDINVNMTSAIDNRMSAYNGSRMQNRQIVITAAVYADYSENKTVGDLRNSVYSLISRIGDEKGYIYVELLNASGSMVQYTWGYISKIESPQFTKDPLLQITIECIPLHLIGGKFKTTGTNSHSIDVPNPGTAPTSVDVTIRVGSESKPKTLVVAVGNKHMFRIDRTVPFVEGDILRLNTTPGERSIDITHAGSTIDLLKFVNSTSQWFEIPSGNVRLWALSETTPNPYKMESVTVTRRYWGAS